MQLDEAKDAYR